MMLLPDSFREMKGMLEGQEAQDAGKRPKIWTKSCIQKKSRRRASAARTPWLDRTEWVETYSESDDCRHNVEDSKILPSSKRDKNLAGG